MLKVWLLETRPHFLLLTPVCVTVGAAVAFYEVGTLHIPHLILAFAGALLAHISVNVLNDYYDFTSGIDLHTRRTAFSGGSGILPAGLLKPENVFWLGVVFLAFVLATGFYFLWQAGLGLLPLGLVGVAVLWFYTNRITRRPLLCLVAPGLGFGPLMVLGTYYTQAGTYSWTAGIASLVPGLLVSNLLLLNQFPDVEADAAGSRRHLPIVIGRKRSACVYTSILVAAYLVLATAVVARVLPVTTLLSLISVPLAAYTARRALRYADRIECLVPALARNVQVVLATPLLTAVGLFLGRGLG